MAIFVPKESGYVGCDTNAGSNELSIRWLIIYESKSSIA